MVGWSGRVNGQVGVGEGVGGVLTSTQTSVLQAAGRVGSNLRNRRRQP